MKLNRKYVLLVSEAVIPILGFFAFDWGLYFILLFYFFDVFAQEVLMHVKSKKIVTEQNLTDKKPWFQSGAISIILLAIMITLVHCVMLVIHPSIDFIDQIKLFWTYEEMGVQQGYILFPLVGLMAYMQYKTDFLARRMERVAELDVEWKKHLRGLLTIIGFTGVALGLGQFIVFSEVVYLLGVVVVIGAYTLLIKD